MGHTTTAPALSTAAGLLLAISGADPDWHAFAQNLYGRALALNGQPDRAIVLITAALAHWEARGMAWARMSDHLPLVAELEPD